MGNPTTDPSFKNAPMQVKRDGKAYKVHGCDQPMPDEVRQMGAYLRMSSNNLKDLQMLVVTLLSIKMFLQGNNLGNKVKETETLCLMNETGPINLCFHILGKSDTELVHLYLWLDDDCPASVPFVCCWSKDLQESYPVGLANMLLTIKSTMNQHSLCGSHS